MLAAVARRRRVGQVPRVQLDDQRLPGREQLGDLNRQRPVGLHLVDVDAKQLLQILRLWLEEGPLVALEVHPDRATHRREGLVATGVQQLDDDVHVAVGLDVGALARVRLVGAIRRRVVPEERHEAARRRAHGRHSSSRTASGHPCGSSPWVRNSPSAIRSRPKPRQAECATPPSASSIPKLSVKCSWW